MGIISAVLVYCFCVIFGAEGGLLDELIPGAHRHQQGSIHSQLLHGPANVGHLIGGVINGAIHGAIEGAANAANGFQQHKQGNQQNNFFKPPFPTPHFPFQGSHKHGHNHFNPFANGIFPNAHNAQQNHPNVNQNNIPNGNQNNYQPNIPTNNDRSPSSDPIGNPVQSDHDDLNQDGIHQNKPEHHEGLDYNPANDNQQFNTQPSKNNQDGDQPLHVPLNPNDYNFGGDKVPVSDPKREADQNKPAADEEIPIDIRFGEK